MRVAFIGPVGAGKSARAQRLSGGDLVRAQIEARTPLGARIGAYHDAGRPVPDEVVLDLLVPHVRPAGGFVLDDFPADVGQAGALDAVFRHPEGPQYYAS